MLDKHQTTFIQLFTLRVVEIASLPHSTLPIWVCKWLTNFYASRVPRMRELVWMSNIAWKTVRLVPWRRSAQGALQWSIRPRENQKGLPSGNWCRRRIFQGHVFCHSPLHALVKALIHRKSAEIGALIEFVLFYSKENSWPTHKRKLFWNSASEFTQTRAETSVCRSGK